jgi:hypothetical protein
MPGSELGSGDGARRVQWILYMVVAARPERKPVSALRLSLRPAPVSRMDLGVIRFQRPAVGAFDAYLIEFRAIPEMASTRKTPENVVNER